MPSGNRKIVEPRTALAAAVLLFALDRVLKAAALASGEPAHGLVGFGLFLNRGTAFSWPVPMPLVIAASCFGAAVVAWLVWRSARRGDAFAVAALTVAALGAVSNLYDRLAHGAVVDYVVFLERGAVNLADLLVVAGLAGYVILETRRGEK